MEKKNYDPYHYNVRCFFEMDLPQPPLFSIPSCTRLAGNTPKIIKISPMKPQRPRRERCQSWATDMWQNCCPKSPKNSQGKKHIEHILRKMSIQFAGKWFTMLFGFPLTRGPWNCVATVTPFPFFAYIMEQFD